MKDPKLIEALKLVQEVADDVEALDAEGALDAPIGEPSPEEVADLAGPPGGPEDMAAPQSPEDEALNLLRDIATGITRMADEIAPIEPPEEVEEPGEEEKGKDEGGEEPPALPSPDEEDDETVSGDTMPVATGA